ncbi:uncharacterized protein LOC133420233 isoform X1 [Cololabis saira]|uniref:uncharacterized protein LOC133420233 isoform X1 n=1 Tax=Cololabis saira TaxID=129043 RepID=UPI002AD5010A|nr:uncharacterized protein LOC133420233 isoform X1 [Cololabis saira]
MTHDYFQVTELNFILVFVHVMSTGPGTHTAKTAQVVYLAAEQDNITISWDFHAQTDVSSTTLNCIEVSHHSRTLFLMVRGDEVAESQDPQFRGRVRCDKDALKDGQIKFRLSRLTPEDSGSYVCQLTHFDRTLGRTAVQASVNLVLNVDNSPSAQKPPPSRPMVTKKTPTEAPSTDMKWGMALAILGLVAVVGHLSCCLTTFYRRYNKDQRQDNRLQQRDALIDLLINVNTP